MLFLAEMATLSDSYVTGAPSTSPASDAVMVKMLMRFVIFLSRLASISSQIEDRRPVLWMLDMRSAAERGWLKELRDMEPARGVDSMTDARRLGSGASITDCDRRGFRSATDLRRSMGGASLCSGRKVLLRFVSGKSGRVGETKTAEDGATDGAMEPPRVESAVLMGGSWRRL